MIKHKKFIIITLLITIILNLILFKQKNIFYSNNIKLINDNNKLLNYSNLDIKKTRNIIISLTVIPPRFITKEFDKVIDGLNKQQIKPDLIIINICKKYKRNFNYNKQIYDHKIKRFEKKYNNVKLNWCQDYGPATKVLGLESYNLDNFNDDDFIIILDDDGLYNNLLTSYYLLTYNLYECDGVGVSDNNTNLFLAETQNKLLSLLNSNNKSNKCNKFHIKKNTVIQVMNNNKIFGVYSWSLKKKVINSIIDITKEILLSRNELWKHDDMLFTVAYRKLKLYMCSLNINMYNMLNIGYRSSLFLDNPKVMFYRTNLELKYRKIYRYKTYKQVNLENRQVNLENSQVNLENSQVNLLNKRLFALTIETPNINKFIEIKEKINNHDIYIKTFVKNNKQTYFYETDFDLFN